MPKWLPNLPGSDPFSPFSGGVRLSVRAAPKASSERVIGLMEDANGVAWVKIALTAAPEDGKANARLIAFLAKQLKIAKSDISLIQGHTQRNKILQINTAPEAVKKWLIPFRSL